MNRNSNLLDEWNYKLDQSTLSKLKKCKTLYYPGAGYDFSTLQFFMENSNVKNFYYVNYCFESFDSILHYLKEQLFPYEYQILDIMNLNPMEFNENNWNNFYHPDYIQNHSTTGPNFITKIIIKKDHKLWNLFYFGTEGIATYEILLKNRIKLDIIVAIDHGSWSPFCGKSLLEVLAKRYRTIPSLILSDKSLQWDNFIPCSELFGKFGFTEEKRMLYYLKK